MEYYLILLPPSSQRADGCDLVAVLFKTHGFPRWTIPQHHVYEVGYGMFEILT
jgi:hypothetical protein